MSEPTAAPDGGASDGAAVHAAVNGTAAGDAAEQVAEAGAAPPAEAVLSPAEQLDRELAKAEADPANFEQWVAVAKLADKLGDIERSRRAYDGLLAEFPLCYGYWKRYADAEHRAGGSQWALHVYERAAAATPYSPDLWGYYVAYQRKVGAAPEVVRQLFETGLAYVGSDFLAHGLWDGYLEFETGQANWPAVTALYLRILGTPLKELDRYYASLRQFADERAAGDLMAAEEQARVAQSLRDARRAQVEAQKAAGDPMDADAPPAAEAAPAAEPAAAGAAEPAAGGAEVEEEEEELSEEEVKAHWLSGVEALYQGTKEELNRRRRWEDAIRRPYFHVKPLDAGQLAAWAGYLDYAERGGDAGTAVRLFERCLVACASYPEFWVRYVRYLEGEDPGSAPATVARAEQVFCKRSAPFLLFAARFHERRGDAAAARAAYRRALAAAPGLVEAVAQAAAFERRQGDAAAARSLYEDALATEVARDGAGDGPAALAMFFAHFLHLELGDTAGARGVLRAALERAPGLRYLWEAAIHFEEHCPGPDRTERVLELYRRATAPGVKAEGGEEQGGALPESDVEALSSSHVDFAARCADAAEAERVSAAHAKRFGQHAKLAASRKRQAEASDGGESKRAAADAATPAPAAGEAGAAAPANGTAAVPADPAAYAGAYASAGYPASGGYPAGDQAAYYQQYGYNSYYYPQQQQQPYSYAAGQYTGYQ